MRVNEYGITPAANLPTKQSTMAAAVASREMEQVKGQITMARMFPRDMVLSRSRILEACRRPDLAEKAEYSFPRGGETVTGASIRLAEVIAQNYGNLDFGIRELEQNDGYSKVEAFCWDMETNVRRTTVFDVKHERHTRQGVTRLSDPRDIYELMANNAARRLRACILQLVPGDVVDEAVAACRQTIKDALNKEDGKRLLARSRKLVDAFATYGVTANMLTEYMQGRAVDQWTADDIAELTKIGTSIKDGVSKPADYFAGATATQVISKAQVEEINKLIGKGDTQTAIRAMNEAGYKQVQKITLTDFEKVKAAIIKAGEGK
jgi:hypothetical protein